MDPKAWLTLNFFPSGQAEELHPPGNVKASMKQQQNEWACLSDACDVAEVTRACRLVFSLQSNF